MRPRRWWNVALVAALLASGAVGVWLAIGVDDEPTPESPLQRIDDAIARGAAWLVGAQSDDGAWRSTVYGALRDGPSLTPAAAKALTWLAAYLPGAGPDVEPAAARAHRYVAALIGGDGRPPPLVYPVYTASLTLMVLVRRGEAEGARAPWVRHLRDHQFSPARGFGPEHASHGGWGYTVGPPSPTGGGFGPPPAANLSATTFAVTSLRYAGLPAADPAIVAALRFIRSCQAADGGFFASPGMPALNKAGPAEPPFRSYGSATADGLRALLAAGVDPSSPDVRAALAWLARELRADTHPGDFDSLRAPLRDGYYYYWAWTAAHALARVPADAGPRPAGWAEALSGALLSAQRADGSWANPVTDGHEDDPIIATSLALGALANCRLTLTRPDPGHSVDP